MSQSHMSEIDVPAPRRRWRLAMPSMIWIGLLSGIATGVFWGEVCAPLSVVGDGFIGLLQMTILPYIVVTLIANIGRLSLRQNRQLGWIGGLVLGSLWIITLFSILVLPFSFPVWRSGSFYSAALTETPQQVDFVSLFIPKNIFASLAANQVPAVVVLCIGIGLGLAGLRDRQILIAQLDIFAAALMRVNGFVARLTPVGVFAITASAAGSVSIDEFGRLQAYLIVYTAGALFVGFVVLPILITATTPFSYRDIMFVSKEALATAFATGKLIVALPILIERTEQLIARQHQRRDAEAIPAIDVLYPMAYAFPHLGRLMGLLFIPFTAWFFGNPMGLIEYPRFLVLGLVSYFSGPLLATPILLDQMQLPHDMFQLFVVSGVYCGRLGDMVGVVHLVAFSLATTSGFMGRLKFQPWRLLGGVAFISLLGGGLIMGLNGGLTYTLHYAESNDKRLSHMQLLEAPVSAVTYRNAEPNPVPLLPNENLLSRVRRRGKLRVGYDRADLPFSYFNAHGQLIGFDINMAHFLARDLQVELEFVPFHRRDIVGQMQADHFDVAMSGLVATLERAEKMAHTAPYMDLTMALVVPDHEVRRFKSFDAIRQLPAIRIGVVEASAGFGARNFEQLPNVELVPLVSATQYFTESWWNLDALLTSAEGGAALTVVHPQYEVVVPAGPRVALPLFYAIGNNDTDMRDFLEHWVMLRKKDGTFERNYKHWILGESPELRRPRWCVARDVLGWIR